MAAGRRLGAAAVAESFRLVCKLQAREVGEGEGGREEGKAGGRETDRQTQTHRERQKKIENRQTDRLDISWAYEVSKPTPSDTSSLTRPQPLQQGDAS